MSHFLSRLAARAGGSAAVLAPRPSHRFEPLSEAAIGETPAVATRDEAPVLAGEPPVGIDSPATAWTPTPAIAPEPDIDPPEPARPDRRFGLPSLRISEDRRVFDAASEPRQFEAKAPRPARGEAADDPAPEEPARPPVPLDAPLPGAAATAALVPDDLEPRLTPAEQRDVAEHLVADAAVSASPPAAAEIVVSGRFPEADVRMPRSAPAEATGDVTVVIERIEVRAAPPPKPAPAPMQAQASGGAGPSLSLDAYLQRRSGAR